MNNLIELLPQDPSRTEYGRLSKFLRDYSTGCLYGVNEKKTLRELAFEFFGSDEQKYIGRVRATVSRINRGHKIVR